MYVVHEHPSSSMQQITLFLALLLQRFPFRFSRNLLYVFFFVIFIFSIFAIFGTNQFLGQQYQFCRNGPDATYDADGEWVRWEKLGEDDPDGGPVLC